jgi:hypothetical protein
MADVKVTSNASEVAADLRAAARAFMDTIAAEVAESAIAFNEDIRGPAPGAGKTPFRTGNLQQSGRSTVEGVRFQYKNDARPYSPSNAEQGDPKKFKRGAESYASFAHFSGAEDGQFAADAEDAFNNRFGSDLSSRAEAAIIGLLP